MNFRERCTAWLGTALIATTAFVAIGAAPAAASVASVAPAVGPASIAPAVGPVSAGPTSIGPDDCNGSGGVFAGVASGNIQNGILSASFCVVGARFTKVTVQYNKCCGGTVTLRFFWQIINTAETAALVTEWDQGAFTQSAGQTKWHAWTYGTLGPLRTAQYPCYRGGMRDQNSLVYYITGKICP